MRRRRLITLALAGIAVAGSGLEGSSQTTPPRDLGHGKELYVRYCSGCHGEDGRGEAKTFRPNVTLQELLKSMRDHEIQTNSLVTTAEGRLLGVISRADAEATLAHEQAAQTRTDS